MKRFHSYLILLIALTGLPFLLNNTITNESGPIENGQELHKVFELRTYTTHEGKLDDLHQRFSNHTMDIFEKHGMKNIGYWIPADKDNTLIYIISHESREAAKKNWDAFRTDPEWQKAYEESRADGPIVEKVESVFMSSTEYSPIK